MGFFSATLAALAAGEKVALAILAEFEFAEGTNRFWLNGHGTLTLAAQSWLGTGSLVSVSAITTGEGDAANKLTFTLSGVNAALIALARENEASVRGRTVTVYGQFFHPDTLAPYGVKWALPTADVMDTIGYSASGPSQRSISLTAETIWAERNTAKNAFYADRDQKARFADDRGLEFVGALVNAKTSWPQYG